MKIALGMLLCMGSLVAAPIDISVQTSVLFASGDTLSTTVPIWNFSVNAGNYGVPLYPTSVEFIFVTTPTDSVSQFQATLSNGTNSVMDGPLYFIPGTMQGVKYSGAISALSGSMQFSEAFSQQIFNSGSATLTLLNEGPDVTIGLPPYTIKQDWTVSLGGNGQGVYLGVGAVIGNTFLSMGSEDPQTTATPEPATWISSALIGFLVFCYTRNSRKLTWKM